MTDGVERAELQRISATLAKLTMQIDQARVLVARPPPVPRGGPVLPKPGYIPRKVGDSLAMAEALFVERRRRDAAFGHRAYLLGEPVWDILLFLYIGRKRDWATSIAHATRAIGAASTTALRCIARLEADGLVRRDADPFDRRRTLLRLTDEAALLLDDYVDSMCPNEP